METTVWIQTATGTINNPLGVWELLDLYSEETIQLELKLKDFKEIERVYSTYSHDFVVPASDLNNKIFGFYFDSDIDQTKKQYYNCRIMVGEEVFKYGKLVLTAGQILTTHMENYNVSFYSGLQPLKALLGDDTLADLDWTDMQLLWSLNNVKRLITGEASFDVRVPLISVNRQWNSGMGGDGDITTSPILINELRPAIRVSRIIRKIEQKYGISLDFPMNVQGGFFQRLFIWANKDAEDIAEVPLNVTRPSAITWYPSNRTDDSNKYPKIVATNNTNTHSFRVVETNRPQHSPNTITYVLLQPKSVATGLRYEGKMYIRLVEVTSTGDYLGEVKIDTAIQADYNYIGASNFSNLGRTRYYKAYAYGEEDIIMDNFNIVLNSTNNDNIGTANAYRMTQTFINNPVTITTYNYDFFKALDTPIADFLQSLIRTYNLKAVEIGDNQQDLKLTTDLEFNDVDYTYYTDITDVGVSSQEIYKEIKLTHSEEDYYRNAIYREAYGKEFGSEVYVSDNPDLSETYEVETNFNILSYFALANTNIITSYGFDEDFKPVNPDTLTIFYENPPQDLMAFNNAGAKVTLQLKYGTQTLAFDKYIPFHNSDTWQGAATRSSLTFDQDVNPMDGVIIKNSLYYRFYRRDFERKYGNNIYLYDYTLHLPPPEISRFSMENAIIIGDKRFSIEEASLNATTGETKLKLLDLQDRDPNLVYPPTFYASYDPFYPNQIRYAINQGDNIGEGIIVEKYLIKTLKQGETISFTYVIDAPDGVSLVSGLSETPGTYEVSAACLDDLGNTSSYTTPVQIVTIPSYELYAPTFYATGGIGKITCNMNAGMENTVEPSHYRIEYIRLSNGQSQTYQVVALTQQSMIIEIPSVAPGNYNCRGQIVYNGEYGPWSQIDNVTVT